MRGGGVKRSERSVAEWSNLSPSEWAARERVRFGQASSIGERCRGSSVSTAATAIRCEATATLASGGRQGVRFAERGRVFHANAFALRNGQRKC
jgi:hypothetical protein